MKRTHGIGKWGWIVAALALLTAAAAIVMSRAGVRPNLSYSPFLDRVDARNVAAVTLRGTEIDARLRHAIGAAPGVTASTEFASRVPDFGDASLIPLLRRHAVMIDVSAPSPWTWLLDRVPWPMLLFLAALLGAAAVRIVRGWHGQAGPRLSAAGADDGADGGTGGKAARGGRQDQRWRRQRQGDSVEMKPAVGASRTASLPRWASAASPRFPNRVLVPDQAEVASPA